MFVARLRLVKCSETRTRNSTLNPSYQSIRILTNTMSSISRMASFACTLIWPSIVGAGCIYVAGWGWFAAFIDIFTVCTIARVTGVTTAWVRSHNICTCCIRMTWTGIAFIDILTVSSIASESRFARACVSTRRIRASCIGVAGIWILITFIYVRAVLSAPSESGITITIICTVHILACCIDMTVMASDALIQI